MVGSDLVNENSSLREMTDKTNLKSDVFSVNDTDSFNEVTANENDLSASRTKDSFRNRIILAPMVRISKLPMRLLALDYGADYVFSEEIIDVRLIESKVDRNELFKCYDFREPDGTLVLRIHDRERHKLIVQLGTANKDNALRAAKMVEPHCFGVDVNMGCPKSFSVSGGMGAALLTKPHVVESIMSNLVDHCKIAVTCKIRLLPTLDDGIKFMKMLEKCGVSAITVHGRYPHERPTNAVHLDLIKCYSECVSIPVIANGLSHTRASVGSSVNLNSLDKIKLETGCSSLMLARDAMWNCSIFRCISHLKQCPSECSFSHANCAQSSSQGVEDKLIVAENLLKYCVTFQFPVQYYKYALQNSVGDHPIVNKVRATTLMSEVCSLFNLEEFYRSETIRIGENPQSGDCNVNGSNAEATKRLKMSEDSMIDSNISNDVKVFSFPFEYCKYRKVLKVHPKTILEEFFHKKLGGTVKPVFKTAPFKDSRWKCLCYINENRVFYSTYCERNKKHAEQGAAAVALIGMGLVDDRMNQIYRNEPSLLHLMTMPHSTPGENNLANDCSSALGDDGDKQPQALLDAKPVRLCVHDSVLDWFL